MQNLTKDEYIEIRNKLDFSINNNVTFLMVFIDAALLLLSFYLLLEGSIATFIASQILFSLLFFRSFSLLHECGHETATTSTRLNAIIGHYASLFCFLPYYSWKFSHNMHHTWSGNLNKDPSLGLLKDELANSESTLYHRLRRKIVSISWVSWLPLLGILQHVVFWLYPAILTKDYSKNKDKIFKTIFSMLFIFGVHFSLYSAFPQIFNIYNFGIAIVLFFFWVELINFPHHINMEVIDDKSPIDKFKVWEQSRTTRSCYYPKFVSEFFMYNFNFHIEHHLFSKLPWYRLRQARDLVKEKLLDNYNEEIGFNWNIKHRKIKDMEKCFLAHKPVRSNDS